MTNKGPGSGSEWVDGDALNADDLVDSMAQLKWIPMIGLESQTLISGIAGHSSTNLSGVTTSGGLVVSTDAGVNWAASAGTHALDTTSFIRVCEADRTRAFAIESTGAETAYSSDSGATYNAATTVTMSIAVYDVSFTTTGLIVVVGDDTTNRIKYSNDNGATWNNATTAPSSAVYCVHMFDANNGFAVDASGNIWRTTDGAVNWTDTTDNIAAGTAVATGMSIRSISATQAIISTIGSNNGTCQLYNYSTNTSQIYARIVSAGLDNTCGVWGTANAVYTGFIDATANNACYFLKSTDSGLTWSLIEFHQGSTLTSAAFQKCKLTSLGTNEVLGLVGYGPIMKFNESD